MGSKKRMSRIEAQRVVKSISKQFNIDTYNEWLSFIGKKLPSAEKSFLSFELAREYVRSLKLKRVKEWSEYCLKFACPPTNIPSHPPKYYKNKGWVSWNDFLSAKPRVPSKFLDYVDAQLFVHRLDLRINSCKEWDEYCKSGDKPKDIPHSPQKIYKDNGWVGWDCWFGSALYDLGLSDEEVQDQITFERENIAEHMENIRPDFETDEEVIEAYEQEATDLIEAVKKYLKDNPREEGE